MKTVLAITALFLLLPISAAHAKALTVGDVPFTAQSPFGQWSDPRQQSACEEASVLMAMRWVRGKPLSPEVARRKILDMAAFEQRMYGDYHDTSAADTVERLFRGYYHFTKARMESVERADDIRNALARGSLVLLPVDGRMLGNPYFRRPGPERHMLLVRGYDATTDQFITNDPGTRRGNGFRYASATLVAAIRDYPTTGRALPLGQSRSAMIVVAR